MIDAMTGDRENEPVRRPRQIKRPSLAAGHLRDLKDFLYRLYLEAGGPSLDDIHAVAERRGTENVAGWPGRDSIRRIIASPTVPSSQADTAAVAAALAFLARWDPADAAQRARELWVLAWEHSHIGELAAPVGAVRVRDANPRMLGVHRAIEVAGARGALPVYVPRDVDDEPGGIRASLSEAAEDGGFVILVGKSAAGKTRSLYQAVLDLMPEWWLLHPQRPDELDVLSRQDPEQIVIWLDDLHRFLGGANGLTGGSARRLLQSGKVVMAGTLWPSHYRRYTRNDIQEAQDSHAVERDLLGMAQIVHIPEQLSDGELRRARELARDDKRLRAALEISGTDLIQVIAAAPQVVEAWKHADDYARALLTAAIDAAHLGVRSPLPLDLLRATAPSYCGDRERADADPAWFEAALRYATTRLHGAMSLLIPVPAPDATMGEIAGYVVADYLLQQTEAERAEAPLPDTFWQACLTHITNPADLTRLGESAENCRELEQAGRFYRTAVASEPRAAYRLANLLSASGSDDEALEILLPWATTSDTGVAEFAARLLGRTGRDTDLRARAEAGDSAAAIELVNLLTSVGRETEVRTYAESGNKVVAYRFAELLTEQGRADTAVRVLESHVDSGDWDAADQMTGILLSAGRTDEALDVLRIYAERGHTLAASRLATLLTKFGLEDELRARADAGDWAAAVHLADLLVVGGHEAELTARADSGDRPAAYRLAHLLRMGDRETELRSRAHTGDMPAVYQLADLLAAKDRHHEAIELLRPHAESGDESAVSRLINLLGEDANE